MMKKITDQPIWITELDKKQFQQDLQNESFNSMESTKHATKTALNMAGKK